MTATTFLVSDMTCGHCEKTLRGALADVLPDAPSASISPPTNSR
ncbi:MULTISPECIES: heavy-metal-associated domain-containing protein [Rhizobium/Agrobacterium group]|nr:MULTISPECIES: heavy-metal-associated domain-containing protein [Rhizobium/Agrobacterium group]